MHSSARLKSMGSVAVVAVLSLACSLSGVAAPTTPGRATEPPAEEAILEKSPLNTPSDLADAVRRGVKSKKWTLEEGLVLALQEMTGETDQKVEARPPTSSELTSLIRMARDYLKNGPDADAKAEITRLLAILSPSPASLDAYSKPEGSSFAAPKLASPSRQLDCTALANRGFPTDSATTCFLYRSFDVGGDTYKIFYPSAWGTEGGDFARLEQATEATTAAVHAYNALGGRVGSVYLVFSLLEAPAEASNPDFVTDADATATGSSTPACTVVVYPSGITDVTPEVFRQILAHELFHCYQFENLSGQIFGPETSATDWWVEGSAEFFSNVVYPSVDEEHSFLSSFLFRSEATSLVDLSYENFILFQYLENRFGVDGVLQFLKTLPVSGGRQEQLDSLSAYPDIQQILQDFAEAFIDSRIVDQSGDLITIYLDQAEGSQIIFVTDSMEQTFEAEPFVLRRARISFMPGKRYVVQVSEEAGSGLNAARPTGEASSWTALTEVTESGCPPAAYVTALTTSDASEAYDVKVEVQATGDTGADLSGCTDSCLIGKWELDNPSYETYFGHTVRVPSVTYGGATGVMNMSLTPHNDLSGSLLDFVVKFSDEITGLGGPPIEVDVQTRSNGSGTAFYWADGHILGVSSTDFHFDLEGEASVNGTSYPFENTLDNDSAPSSAFGGGIYFCRDDRLLYSPPLPGVPIGLLTYHRLSH